MMRWIEGATRPVADQLIASGRTHLAEMYRRCFASTWDTTLQTVDGTTFLITGDIPAMWLRDSSAQVYHYVPYAGRYPEAAQAISGLLKRQFYYITLDPYANAFNRTADDRHGFEDNTSWSDLQKPWIWERKYEVDSLCYPIRLAYAFWKQTGNTDWCDETCRHALETILKTWKTEQYHEEQSSYRFVRQNCPPSDTLIRNGKGAPVVYTGMTWSGFRPSDDACMYGYLIPSNFFAVRSLDQLTEIARSILYDPEICEKAEQLRAEIRDGLDRFAVVDHPDFGPVFTYETDGLGHHLLIDDANVPSLLSLPYLGCVPLDDPIYLNTRRMILSSQNPYYYRGKAACGVGSPHTPRNYIWPISLCVQGLTSDDKDEITELLNTLETLDAGTFLMHEGVHKDDPAQYTRSWFAWANSIFSEFVEKAVSMGCL
jgi:hypothetical protein